MAASPTFCDGLNRQDSNTRSALSIRSILKCLLGNADTGPLRDSVFGAPRSSFVTGRFRGRDDLFVSKTKPFFSMTGGVQPTGREMLCNPERLCTLPAAASRARR